MTQRTIEIIFTNIWELICGISQARRKYINKVYVWIKITHISYEDSDMCKRQHSTLETNKSQEKEMCVYEIAFTENFTTFPNLFQLQPSFSENLKTLNLV